MTLSELIRQAREVILKHPEAAEWPVVFTIPCEGECEDIWVSTSPAPEVLLG